jgi:hypothetical protein
VGIDLGHYDGWFLHVAASGEKVFVDESAVVTGFVQRNGDIYAYGWGALTYGMEPGVLWEVSRSPEGGWTSRRIALLPSPPEASAIGPSGELLFMDELNSYAIVDGDIAPLACEARPADD